MRVATYGDGIHIATGNPADLKTLPNRQLRKTGVVLDAAKAFFFQRGDQLAISNQYGRDVGMKNINTEDVHRSLDQALILDRFPLSV